MIALWKKELILKRLKEENNGNLDYITVEDVTIIPFGARNQLRNIEYTIENADFGISHKMIESTASMIDCKLYGGRYNSENYTSNSYDNYKYNGRGYQKYIIIGKPDRFVMGKFIIAVHLIDPISYLDNPTTLWLRAIKPTGYFYEKRGYLFRNNLIMDTSILKGRDINELNKEELIELIPGKPTIGVEDVSDIKITHINVPETISNNVGSRVRVKSFYSFKYIKVEYFLKMTEDEAGLFYNYFHDKNIIVDGLLKPNAKSLCFFIINKDVYANASKLFYGGNTDNLTISLEEGDVKMTGVKPNRDNLSFATVGLSLLREDYPDYADMQYKYFFDFNYRKDTNTPLYIHMLSVEVQTIIINAMTRFHHWKWGAQNQPNNYSETPSSHNLKNAIVKVIDRQPYKYTSSRDGSIQRRYFEQQPNIFFNKHSISKYPEDDCEGLLSIGIYVDEEYNTSYDGTMYLQIYTKTSLFDAGIQRG